MITQLLKLSFFKVIIFAEKLENVVDVEDSVSLLELGALALLWCDGSVEDKAKFFVKLVSPQ